MELVLEMNRVSRFIVSEYIIVKSSEVMTIIPGGLFASFRWTVAPPPNARTPGTFQRRKNAIPSAVQTHSADHNDFMIYYRVHNSPESW